MSTINTSNDSLIYNVIRGGRHIVDNRDMYSIAFHFDGIECHLEEDYSPTFNLKEGHWSKEIKRNSLHYKRMMHAMYFEAWHYMNDELPNMVRYRTAPPVPSMGPRSMVESTLDYRSREMGEKFYLTVFLRALLATDFAEKATTMPDYIYSSNH